jgi:prepilin-type N-terminal cleavage/methylation domain-containing protein
MRNTRRPRGFTLLEMIVVMGCTTILLTLCVATIHTLFQAERSARRDWAEAASIGRLGEVFRRDVHAATAPPEFPGPTSMVVKLGQAVSVTYRIEDDRVVVARDGEGEAGPRSESFRFSRWAPQRFERSEAFGHGLARLVFRPSANAEGVEMPIEASIGVVSNSEVTP